MAGGGRDIGADLVDGGGARGGERYRGGPGRWRGGLVRDIGADLVDGEGGVRDIGADLVDGEGGG